MSESVITKYDNICLICDGKAEHKHHAISGRGKRNLAEECGLFCYLCAKDHNMFQGQRPAGWSCDVHHCPKLERLMKCVGQLAYEKSWLIEKYSLPFTEDSDEAREAFRRKFGESYL